MILAFDTYYENTTARTVAVEFESWEDNTITNVYEELLTEIADYVSGQFYKRELPCILSLLKQIPLETCSAIIIDGFVVLDDQGAKGLGGYLYEALEERIPIIGVAKNDFSGLETQKRAILRGESKKPLYITAKGLDLDKAATVIQQLEGAYRMPMVLKEVDRIGRIPVE